VGALIAALARTRGAEQARALRHIGDALKREQVRELADWLQQRAATPRRLRAWAGVPAAAYLASVIALSHHVGTYLLGLLWGGLAPAVFALTWSLAPGKLRLPPKARLAAVAALLEKAEPAAAGALAMVAGLRWAGAAAKNRLEEIAGAVSYAEAAEMETDELEALSALLAPHVPKRSAAPDWDVVAAAARVLAKTTYEPAVERLRHLCEPEWRRMEIPPEVRRQAQHTIETILANIEKSPEKEMLLRATSTDALDTDRLLRPAPPGEEPPEQLLRQIDHEE
jgi:hypothetical protein